MRRGLIPGFCFDLLHTAAADFNEKKGIFMPFNCLSQSTQLFRREMIILFCDAIACALSVHCGLLHTKGHSLSFSYSVLMTSIIQSFNQSASRPMVPIRSNHFSDQGHIFIHAPNSMLAQFVSFPSFVTLTHACTLQHPTPFCELPSNTLRLASHSQAAPPTSLDLLLGSSIRLRLWSRTSGIELEI